MNGKEKSYLHIWVVGAEPSAKLVLAYALASHFIAVFSFNTVSEIYDESHTAKYTDTRKQEAPP